MLHSNFRTNQFGGHMNKIILSSYTPGKTDDVKEILDYAGAFEVLICVDGIDRAVDIAKNENYDLLIFSLDDIPENSYVSIMQLQMACPNVSVLAYGTTLQYTEFLSKFLGEKVNQLEYPVDAEKVIKTVSRALGLSKDVARALKKKIDSASLSSDTRPMVLLIDDSAVFLRSMKTVLEDKYRVCIASSGASGLRQMVKKNPDLILLDYEMPEMDGAEVLSKIRNDKEYEKFKDMKVLFLTGVSDQDKVKAVMALKPLGYLLKTMAFDTLMSEIDKGLKQ